MNIKFAAPLAFCGTQIQVRKVEGWLIKYLVAYSEHVNHHHHP